MNNLFQLRVASYLQRKTLPCLLDNTKLFYVKANCELKAINFVLQGSALVQAHTSAEARFDDGVSEFGDLRQKLNSFLKKQQITPAESRVTAAEKESAKSKEKLKDKTHEYDNLLCNFQNE